MRRVTWWSVAALAAVAGLAGLTGCAGPAPTAAASAAASAPSITVPFDAAEAGPGGAIAVVAMGRLGDPLNTFWELFVRGGDAATFDLATPPGVADNGGLVASADSTGATRLLTGFEPSQDLAFSPLALSGDGGGSWSPGLLPGGLAVVPDALALSPALQLALLRARGGEVVASVDNGSHWNELVDRRGLVSSPAGRSCRPGALTAVAVDGTGLPLVGTTCAAAGVVGIFGRAGGRWSPVAPPLTGTARHATKVLRLVDTEGTVNALVAVASTTGPVLMAMARSKAGRWTHSSLLPMGRRDRIVSTGVESGGGFVVLISRPGHGPELDAEAGAGGGWRPLPSPPAQTAAVVVGADGEVDALSEDLVQLTDWRLDAAAGTWSKIETVTVPIEFGSSS